MSLINCPECGKQISDKAPACPNCGYPMELYWKERQEKGLHKEEYRTDSLSQETTHSSDEDAVLAVKEDLSDFDFNSHRSIRSFKVDPGGRHWICAGCKVILYDTLGESVGGEQHLWKIISSDQVDEELWLTIFEEYPLQKYNVSKMRIVNPCDETVYTQEEWGNVLRHLKDKIFPPEPPQ